MSESLADQITRLQLMAGGDPKYDLSPNDRAAIGRALDALTAQEAKKTEAEPVEVKVEAIGNQRLLTLAEPQSGPCRQAAAIEHSRDADQHMPNLNLPARRLNRVLHECPRVLHFFLILA